MPARQRRAPRQFDMPQRARQWFERMDFVTLAQAQMVADYANVSRVARVLGVRQSAVSRRIRPLEDELGVSLFERRQNGVRLTVAGRRFVERTRAALTEIESAARNAAASVSTPVTNVSVNLSPGDAGTTIAVPKLIISLLRRRRCFSLLRSASALV